MQKTILITLVLLLCVSLTAQAQTVPSGMRYQAIARDLDGNIQSGEPMTVKVELVAIDKKERIVYTEFHDAVSGEFGLLNMTIGEGNKTRGSFADVPWSQQNLWVRVSIKLEKNDDFQIITSSKFYSVPYAFYANSAGKLVEQPEQDHVDNSRDPEDGSNSSNWTLDGNRNAQERNDGNPVLGTTDENDLVVVTNNVTRLTIDVAGNSNFTGDLDVDGQLNVDQDVTLNSSGGATTINGATTVENMSPTLLTGTLTVDKSTTFQDALTVSNMAPTHLTGALDVDKTLNVDGATTLNNSLDVSGPTHLSGTLGVDLAMNIGDALTVANMAPTHLTGTLDVDKTLNVDGAATLNNSLDVTGPTHLTGTLRVDLATNLGSALTVENMAATHLTGALDVDKTLNVDGATTLNGSLDVTGNNPTNLTGTLNVGQAATLQDALTVANMASTHLTGSLTVDKTMDVSGTTALAGALDVTGATHLTGTLAVDELATMNGGLSVSGPGTLGPNNEHIAFFDNTDGGSGDGVGIRIQKENTTAANNFVTFYRGNDEVAGRIEGYVLSDIGTPPLPSSDEIWTAICIAIADYNPITIVWTQFASKFNLFGTIWNGTTIPSIEIPDFPGLALPDFPGLPLPDFPGLVLPDFPGLVLPNFNGVVIPDVPSVSIPDVGTVFPGLSLPDIPSVNIPDIPSFAVPNIPPFGIPDIPAFPIPDIPAFEIPDIPEIDLSADWFEIPVIPTFSDILMDLGVCPDAGIFDLPDGNGDGAGYVYRLIEWGVQNDMQNMISFDPVDLAGKALTWGVTKVVKVGGVTYGAKGADYAEYLPKMNLSDRFLQGEVVGVHGGKISRNTKGADQILAISTNPIVLGNTPDNENLSEFEKVGFLGQVPVYVKGPVEVGDYIIPSGKNDGIGEAISSSELNADLLPQVIGKAWSGSEFPVTAVINVSIGLRPTEIAEVLKQREEKLENLQEQVEMQNSVHSKLKADVDLLKEYLGMNGFSTADLKSN